LVQNLFIKNILGNAVPKGLSKMGFSN